MNAIELLVHQHQEVSRLFEKAEATEDGRTRRSLFDALAARLAAHDAIEREIFYPACKAALGKENEELGESLVEHGVVELLIHKGATADADDLPHCLKVLKDVVEHHVEEEQDELFPKVKKAISAEELLALGEEMEQRFGEAMETDYREAVRKSLMQVVGGAIETEAQTPDERVAPRAPRKAPAKKKAARKASPQKATPKRPASKARATAKKSGGRGKSKTGGAGKKASRAGR